MMPSTQTFAKCNRCNLNRSAISGIITGKYYRELCWDCYDALQAAQRPSSGLASYNRQRDVEDNQAALAQPYVGGKPNPEFIQIYPEKAAEMFTADEMRRYG